MISEPLLHNFPRSVAAALDGDRFLGLVIYLLRVFLVFVAFYTLLLARALFFLPASREVEPRVSLLLWLLPGSISQPSCVS